MRKDLLRRAIWELAPLWVLGLLFLLFWGFCEFNGPVRQYLNHQSFDSERWKRASEADRYDLAWDLLHGRLDGLTTAEVNDLLGDTQDKELTSRGRQEWWYYLGPDKYDRPFALEVARLLILFENDRVVRVTKR